jgi:cysteine-rich repeat protein
MLPLLPASALAAALAVSPFTPDSFHLMKVREVFPGSDAAPNAQYVMLQMYAAGQNLVSGKQLRVFNSSGTMIATFTFAANMPVSLDQTTILIATPEAQVFFAPGGPLTADLMMTPMLPALGGKVCFHDPGGFGDVDCVSWGGYTGDPAGVGTPFNAPVGLVKGAAIRRRLDICLSPTNLDGCDDTENSANDFRAVVPAPRNNAGVNGAVPPSTCGNGTVQSLEQCDDNNTTSGDGCSSTCTRETTAFAATALALDAAPSATSDGNGVFEKGETVGMAPTWRNASTAALPLSGRLSSLTGPAGGTYVITDGVASYGTVAAGGTASCGADCYWVSANASARPALHWDATAAEVLSSDGFRNWALHVGESFVDVPKANPFYRFVEILLHRGITSGCNATSYCPGFPTQRDAMSVFVLVAKEGPGYMPPACGTPMFTDVPASSPFCPFIEELARRGVSGGCAPSLYCPTAGVTREQMAVFVLRTLDPTLNPPACAPPNTFDDVPETSAFCRWIEELARRNVVQGCSATSYCPASNVTREQMGVFLGVTFGLTLNGL